MGRHFQQTSLETGPQLMQQYQRLAMAGQILLWTTGFSLLLSVIMVAFMYMRRKKISEV